MFLQAQIEVKTRLQESLCMTPLTRTQKQARRKYTQQPQSSRGFSFAQARVLQRPEHMAKVSLA
jgi:hypothetical protein